MKTTLKLLIFFWFITQNLFAQQIQFERVLPPPPAPQIVAEFCNNHLINNIAYADVDGDNDQDVLINSTLYINDGYGNFSIKTDADFDDGKGVAFADIDGDNDLDVMIHSVLYINDGNGNFTEVTGTPFIDFQNENIAFADIDGDNDQDVLITGINSNGPATTKLYINDGNGNFTIQPYIPFGNLFGAIIAFADIDGDNDQDLLIDNKLYTNDGNGNFTEVTGTPFVGVYEGSIAITDIDGDNDQDVLITGHNSSGYVSKLYTNDGNGNFTEVAGTSFVGVYNSSAAFADIDGDNDQDVLITGNNSFGYISKLYTNDGNGNFTEVYSIPFSGKYTRVIFADFDGDNDMDVLLAGESTQLYLNDSSGNFISTKNEPILGLRSSTFAFADIDGDNDQDIFISGYLYSNSNHKTIIKYINNGNGHYVPFIINNIREIDVNTINFADIDSDNDQDLLLTGIYANQPIVKLYENDGSGNFTGIRSFTSNSNEVYAASFADIDGDNDQDILICEKDFNNDIIVKEYKNNGNGNYTWFTDNPFYGIRVRFFYFADIDGDNDQDILVTGRNANNDIIKKLYTNDGNGNFNAVPGTPFVDGGYYAAFADVDGDNDMDLLITGKYLANNPPITKLYTNDGNGNFTEQTGTPFVDVIGLVTFADYDGDNDQDVLISGFNNNDTSKFYTNDGNGNFTEVINVPFTNIHATTIAFTDVDNDNKLDLFITGYLNYGIPVSKLFINDNSGNFVSSNNDLIFDIYYSTFALVDIDGDNDEDLFISGLDINDSYYGNTVTKKYLNDGNGNFTEVIDNLFPSFSISTINFADIDSDNDLDVLITGQRYGYSRTKLYTNDGNGNFTEVTGTPFIDVEGGAVAFADIDGDTDLDVLITGISASTKYSKLYTNDGNGNFTEVTGTPFVDVTNSSVAFADIDGDNDLDVLISGENQDYSARLYINDGNGNFSISYNLFRYVSGDSIVFADIDNDGDLDVLISGTNSPANNASILYINDGNGHFTEVNAIPFEGEVNQIALYDLDGDNDQDILITGMLENYNLITKLYANDGNGNFTEVTGTPFVGVGKGTIAFSDIDGDNDQDILISGKNCQGGKMYLYRNITGQVGETPEYTFDNSINIYPNPGENIFKIDTQNKIINQIELFNLQGQAMPFGFDKESGILKVNLPKGIYLLLLNIDKQKISKKIVIN